MPNLYSVKIIARPYGALGICFEKRTYAVRASDASEAREAAITKGHAEKLEHVRCVSVVKIG